jgi:ABC-type bacteriocin/lantibiotic exporter with double-glycine peptidase domain
MRHKFVRQQGIKDCGVTCLYNIIRYYKGNISIDKLRNLTKTDNNGTSIYNIVEASNKLGLKSNAYMCKYNSLNKISWPFIAHIKLDEKYDHFIVIKNIKKDKIIVEDPIRGKVIYDKNMFLKEWTNVVITFEKTNDLVKENSKKNICVFKNKFIVTCFLLVFIISILASIFSLLNSFYLSALYNGFESSKFILFLFLLLSVIKSIIDYIRNRAIISFDKKLNFKVMNKVYKKILSLPLKYHHSRPVGDIVSRINDLSSIREFVNTILFSSLLDILYMILILIFMFIINKYLFLLIFLISVIYIILYLFFRNKIYSRSYDLKEKNSLINSYLVESIVGINTIKNCGIEKERINDFKNKYSDLLDSNIKYNKILLNFNLVDNLISSWSNILILFVGYTLVNKNLLSFSYLLVANSVIIYYFLSFKNIVSLDNLFINAKNSYKRLENFFVKENIIKDYGLIFKDKIEFKNVSFKYNCHSYIDNINFTINKNDFVFIKGPSGVGKSTIFKLLIKELNPNKGSILIDNVNIDELSFKDITDNICFVSQDEIIFTGTILDNIRLYKDVKNEELEKVIKVTGIDKFLKEKNISLNFLLEENGHNVSDGERKRILLARALLQNKKVLILDETTNGIDILSEGNIVRKVKEEYDVTLILISHRYDNLKLFNKVFEIKGGTKCERVK